MYENYHILKEMFMSTWHEIVPQMYGIDNSQRIVLDERYYATITITQETNGRNYIFRLYDTNPNIPGLAFEMSYNTGIKYFSTFSPDAIRIAHWKPEHPRIYALYDPKNAKEGERHTFIQFPCDTDYFFHRMLVQETLEYDDYELWDTEVMVMQEVLQFHPALSIGMMLTDLELHPEVVVYFAQEFFRIYDERNREITSST